jgi:PAS domain S-box-containing protein
MGSAGRKSFIERLKTVLLLGMGGSSRRRKYREKGRTEFEILRAHDFLRSVLQHSHDMIFVTDVHGFLISFNKGGEEALGYPQDEIIGRLLKELAQEPQKLLKLLEDSRSQGSAISMDFSFLHKEGYPVYSNVSLIDLKNADGKSIGTVGICHDITRWKKLEEDLIRVDRLAEMGRIAAGVAHEINNPLAVINEAAGWGAVVAKDAKGLGKEDREELKKIFNDVIQQTKRCRSRTKQVLGFARDSEPTRKEIDIHELIKGTVAFLEPELKYKQIDILYQFTEGPLILKSDPKQLEQVFVNLLTNATYAIKEKGEGKGQITLLTSASDTDAEIQVSDTGTGMSEEVRAKIFDLFFTTKPAGKGTGLGLPICHNIVKKLGGEMTCESRLGKGTTFTIRIPLA